VLFRQQDKASALGSTTASEMRPASIGLNMQPLAVLWLATVALDHRFAIFAPNPTHMARLDTGQLPDSTESPIGSLAVFK